MELNQFPDGYDETNLGPQKRQTEFKSEEEKLQGDARNLINLARSKYGKENITVRDALDLSSRKDDDVEALRRAIAIEIKNKPNTELHTVVEAEASSTELSPEQMWLNDLKTRFNALSQLHVDIEWADVEKSLRANPEDMRKLQALDEKGHEMNVFGEKNGEIQFRSAQTDVTEIASEHRTIKYDKKAKTDYSQYKVNGNAEDIAASMGVELADNELYEQLRVKNGWVWLKTDAATRQTGLAFDGNFNGVGRRGADLHGSDGSFCAALRVKKA